MWFMTIGSFSKFIPLLAILTLQKICFKGQKLLWPNSLFLPCKCGRIDFFLGNTVRHQSRNNEINSKRTLQQLLTWGIHIHLSPFLL